MSSAAVDSQALSLEIVKAVAVADATPPLASASTALRKDQASPAPAPDEATRSSKLGASPGVAIDPPTAPGARTQTQPTDAARLSSALRQSGVGCANADGVHLRDAEREACRQRLAQGAAGVPYISGVPPEKSAYYAALQESVAQMNANPMGGHGPEIHCGDGKKRLGLKLGPCTLAAPMTPETPEADVRGPWPQAQIQ